MKGDNIMEKTGDFGYPHFPEECPICKEKDVVFLANNDWACCHCNNVFYYNYKTGEVKVYGPES